MAANSIGRSGRKLVERVSARVFCHLEDGGNPVTIFSSPHALTAATQQALAQGCDWESVMVHRPLSTQQSQSSTPKLPNLSFYMPSGEQVSFCAHAAMGAALEICLQNEKTRDETNQDDNEKNDSEEEYPEDQVAFTVADDNDNKQYWTTIYDFDIVALEMNTIYKQTNISHPAMLMRMLRDYCRLDPIDLASTPLQRSSNDFEQPSYQHILCHGSIARPKTLVPLRHVDDLHHKAIPPKAGDDMFARSCQFLDDTTGLYLYAKSDQEDGAWECRQFPRSSGYPEDPATGIAAAALACHLYHEHDIELPTYKMYQGTAMGKPSLIVVDELEMTKSATAAADNEEEPDLQASYRILGRVEIDERETLEVDDADL